MSQCNQVIKQIVKLSRVLTGEEVKDIEELIMDAYKTGNVGKLSVKLLPLGLISDLDTKQGYPTIVVSEVFNVIWKIVSQHMLPVHEYDTLRRLVLNKKRYHSQNYM